LNEIIYRYLKFRKTASMASKISCFSRWICYSFELLIVKKIHSGETAPEVPRFLGIGLAFACAFVCFFYFCFCYLHSLETFPRSAPITALLNVVY